MALIFARREGWSFGDVGDLFAPALAIGHAFGRLGCFAAGCCFGKETASRIGVAFPRGSVAFDVLQRAGADPARRRRDAARCTRRSSTRRPASWRCSACSARSARGCAGGRARCCSATSGLYALLRFVVEIFRGDVLRGFPDRARDAAPGRAGSGCRPAEPIFLSAGQLGSLLTVAAVAAALIWRHRAPRTPAP